MNDKQRRLAKLRGEVDALKTAGAPAGLTQRIETATFSLPPGFAGALAAEWARSTRDLFERAAMPFLERFAAAAVPDVRVEPPAPPDFAPLVAALGGVEALLTKIAAKPPAPIEPRFAFSPTVNVTPEIRVEIEKIVMDVVARMPARTVEIVGDDGKRSTATVRDGA